MKKGLHQSFSHRQTHRYCMTSLLFAISHSINEVSSSFSISNGCGSVLWDIFSPAAVAVESSYNRSMKVTMGLHYATHRELIEPLSGTQHLKLIFIKRFLNMIASIRKSNKPILNMLLCQIETDTRSTTGRNLRNIMLLLNKTSINEITSDALVSLEYCAVNKDREWRVELVELLMMEREQEGLEQADLEWLEWLCTN